MKHVQHTAAHPPLCHAHASWVPARSPAMLTRHPDQQCAAGQACHSFPRPQSRGLKPASGMGTARLHTHEKCWTELAGIRYRGVAVGPPAQSNTSYRSEDAGSALRAHDAPPAAAAASSSFCRFSMPCRQAQSSGTARELGAAATHERQKQRVSGKLGISPQACEGRRHRALVQPAPTPSSLPCLP